MLRLPPTRIMFDARDIEYHALNGEERMKQLVSQGLKKRTTFGYPFAQLNELKASLVKKSNNPLCDQSEQDEQPGISEQLLRDTVSPNSRREPWDYSLDNTNNIKSGNADLLYVDGQVETFTDMFSQTNDLDIFKHNSTPEESSIMPRATSYGTSVDIEKLTNKLQDLTTEYKNFNSMVTHEGRATPIDSNPGHLSRLSMSEPRLPSPISQVSQMDIRRQTLPIRPGGAHYSSPTQYLLHASPAESAFYSIPREVWHAQTSQSFTPSHYQHQPTQNIPQTTSSTGLTNGINRVYSIPDLIRYRYHTNPPIDTTTLPDQRAITLASMSDVPRTPRGRIRPRTVEEYSDVLDFGQPQNSRNAYARQRNGLFIYDDDLPSELQPQTPFGLPRHGIPHSAYPQTAPPAPRFATTMLQPTTPTRPDRRHPPMVSTSRPNIPHHQDTSDYDQENAAMYVEMERRSRVRADRRMATRRGTDSLDVTPPMALEDSIG